MTDQPGKRFSFVSNAAPADTFTVVRFRGEEGLSRCYRFEVELAARDAALDLESILRMPATFVIHRPEGDVPFHGILAEFRQSHQAGVFTFYKAVLVPRLWWLSLTHHNQVFLDQTMPQIVEACLQDGGLTTDDYESRFQNIFPAWEYVCQYRESHLAFVSRWMERGGVYFYFEQDGAAEKVIITDTKVSHTAMPEGETLRYRALAAMETFHREEVIWGFECRRHLLPQSLLLKDYNCNTPSLDLSARTPVSPNGRGEWYLYGENFLTPEEGQLLAQARAEELLCREQQFTGESAIPFLRPGYTFQLQDHYRDGFNQQYLTVALEHEGSQAAYLLAGLGVPLTPGEEEPFYRNRFTAIPASVQFRPERKTEKARFFGFMNAKVDAAASGQYAELDELGRYKVILPFDVSGRKDGKASAWLRMMQPYAGSDHGMHFPLHKGTEVLLAFIDGDPDRPVIAGAVPNPATPSPVSGDNQTMAVLQTGGSNRMAIEDKAGSERFLFHVPNQGVYLRIGAPNDPPVAPTPTPTPTRPVPPTPTPTPTPSQTPPPTDDSDLQKEMESLKKEVDDLSSEVSGLKAEMEGDLEFKCHNEKTTISGNKFEMVIGGVEETVVGAAIETFIGNYTHSKLVTAVDITLGVEFEFKLTMKNKYLQNEFKFAPHRWGVHFEHVDVEKSVHTLAENVGTLALRTTRLANQQHDLSTEVNKMAINSYFLAGETHTLAEAMNLLNSRFVATGAEQSTMFLRRTSNVLQESNTVLESTRNIGDEVRRVGQRSETVADETRIMALSQDLAGEKIMI